MEKDLNTNPQDGSKVSEVVKVEVESFWDSNTLTLLGVIIGIVLAILFGAWAMTGDFIKSILISLICLIIVFMLIKWKKSKSKLINFMTWLMRGS